MHHGVGRVARQQRVQPGRADVRGFVVDARQARLERHLAHVHRHQRGGLARRIPGQSRKQLCAEVAGRAGHQYARRHRYLPFGSWCMSLK